MALAGKTIVFTGTLTMKRAEATKLASAAGAKVTGSVSKSTNIIVAASDAATTAKVLTAKAFGTLIWSEEDFGKAIATKGKAAVPKAPAKGRTAVAKAPPKRAKPISEKEQHVFADLAKARNFDKVMSLIKENAGYINVQPAGRWAAIHQAAEAGHEEAVKFLVAHGADLEAKTKDGKTPKDVAKANVKDLLKAPPKRKAPESGAAPPAKRAAGAPSPKLHLFKNMSSTELQEEMGGWFVGDECGMVHDDVKYGLIKDAPHTTIALAKRLQKKLDGVTLPAGESDCHGMVIVISSPGEDPKDACLRALAIKEEVDDDNGDDDEDAPKPWEQAEVSDQNFAEVEQFCRDDDEDEDSDDEDGCKIKSATKELASLSNQFTFNFTEEVVTAPIIWGGYMDGSIVGVLGMRVWT